LQFNNWLRKKGLERDKEKIFSLRFSLCPVFIS